MNQKYCSIDLEFTGFDPEKEQILEIGFAFFDVSDEGLVATESWSQVFKPTIEVHQKILGLTGITQEEIDAAPSIGEFKDFLSEKLQDAIIVAHNPTLDIKFLELAGVKLSGKSIDTLELVQFLLPTHHSYNLENLMHYFGIAHKDSHRALADCLSTISLLEKMIAIHNSFSDDLKTELREFLDKGQFEWASLLNLKISNHTIEANDSLSHDQLADDKLISLDQEVIIDDKHFLHESRVANSLQDQDGRWLLVMQSKQEVIKLWQAGLVEGVFETKDLFDKENFEQFKFSAQSSEEYRFILKILVWLHTNWQTKTILDLNLSFFGGQFKNASDPVTMGFIFSDALAGNGTELVRGVLDAMGRDFKLAGGAASDDMQFKKTYQYFNDEVLTDAAVGFGITGPMLIAAGAEHGWKPIGNPRIVTKAEGTKLIELDGKPAFQIYQDYFGDRASDFKQALTLAAVSYPLGMKAKGVEEIMVRVPLAVSDDGSIVCGAELIEGSEVSLMIGTLSSTLWAAEATAKAAMKGMEGAGKRVIFVSDCVARKILLGERGKEEIALLKTVGGENTEIFGFYSYGQIAPLKPPSENINTCDPGFYEQSISVTVCGF